MTIGKAYYEGSLTEAQHFADTEPQENMGWLLLYNVFEKRLQELKTSSYSSV